MGTRPVAVGITIVRYRLRPIRRRLARIRAGSARLTWRVRLGPRQVAGHQVLLRSPRFDDAEAWREIRLRARDHIEPWWASAETTWEERHTDTAWITSLVQVRDRARAGRALPLVLEIDGRLAGGCSLEWIAPDLATAELSVWLDPRWSNAGVSGVAAGLLVDYSVRELGVQRLIAPIAVGNTAAMWGARRIGMRRECTMAGYLDVAGRRLDHELWAVTADQLPSQGLAAVMAAVAARGAAVRRIEPTSRSADSVYESSVRAADGRIAAAAAVAVTSADPGRRRRSEPTTLSAASDRTDVPADPLPERTDPA